ncbi:MAG: hypothetical protein AAF533_24440 [Acidobacteriota bacterium]
MLRPRPIRLSLVPACALAVGLSCAPVRAEVNAWSSLDGPRGFVGASAVVPLPGDAGVVVIRDGSGTFITEDGGATWRSQNVHGLRSQWHYDLVGDASVLYRLGGAQNPPLWFERSFDRGRNWERWWPEGPDWSEVRSLALTGDLLLTSDRAGAWRSADDGETWELFAEGWPDITTGVERMVASPDASGGLRVLAGHGRSGVGLLRWDAVAGTWQQVTGTECTVLALGHSAAGIDAGAWALLAGLCSPRGLYRSRDGGSAWELVVDTETQPFGLLAAHPTEPDVLLAASTDQVHRSRDGGDTWESVLTIEADDQPVRSLGIGEDGHVVVGTNLHLWWSDDDGLSWRDVAQGLHARALRVAAGSVDGEESRDVVLAHVQASADQMQLYRRVGAGGAWEPLTIAGRPPWGFFGFGALVADPTQADTFLALTDSTELYRTTDGGDSWTGPAVGIPAGSPILVTFDPTRSGVVLAGSYRSEDGGLTWAAGGSLGEDRVIDWIARDTTRSGRWVASTRARDFSDNTLSASDDDGQTWSPGPESPPLSGPTEFRVLHVAGERMLGHATWQEDGAPRLWRHESLAAGWVPAEVGLPDERHVAWDVTGLLSDPGFPDALVMTTRGLGHWRSHDGGASWTSLDLGPDGPTVDVNPANSTGHYPDALRQRKLDGGATEYVVPTGNGVWTLTLDDSDLLLRVHRSDEGDAVLSWPESEIPVWVTRGTDPMTPLRALGPGSVVSTATDSTATEERLYFYRVRH